MTRETAINLLDNLIGMVEDNQQNDYDEAFKIAIRSLKSWDEDVTSVVHGKWIDKMHDNIYECSKCGDMWMGIGGCNYCPSCGARMDGDK